MESTPLISQHTSSQKKKIHSQNKNLTKYFSVEYSGVYLWMHNLQYKCFEYVM